MGLFKSGANKADNMANKEQKTSSSERDDFASKSEGPDFHFEQEAMTKFGGCVAGTDEAGRGPWAGPVVAGAVILNPDDIPPGLNDSKKLTEAKRDTLFDVMNEWAEEERLYIGVGIADVERIDRDNILKASLWAMGEAVSHLTVRPRSVLVDGNKLPELPVPALALVKGDSRSLSIAAASIIAKVTRDRMMVELSEAFPAYKWASNKGYGTKDHQLALAEHGVTEHHRRSFKPIRALL